MIKTSSDGIKQLSEEFLKLPSQGIAASLHGNDTCIHVHVHVYAQIENFVKYSFVQKF